VRQQQMSKSLKGILPTQIRLHLTRRGPLSPFALGAVLLEWVVKSGWIETEGEGRMRKYYITDSGEREMMAKGIEVDKIFHYKEFSKKDMTEVFGGR
jgi:hypothetical protein